MKKQEINEMEPKDQWFDANLRCLLGGEVLLVQQRKQNNIDRKRLLAWIKKHI